MSSYLSHHSKSALRALTASSKLQIRISNPGGKILQNINFLPISQNSYLNIKWDSTCQNKSGGMLGFQNRSQKANQSKLHAKQCNRMLSWKMHFLTGARSTNLRPSLDSWHQNNSESGFRLWFRVPVRPQNIILVTCIIIINIAWFGFTDHNFKLKSNCVHTALQDRRVNMKECKFIPQCYSQNSGLQSLKVTEVALNSFV